MDNHQFLCSSVDILSVLLIQRIYSRDCNWNGQPFSECSSISNILPNFQKKNKERCIHKILHCLFDIPFQLCCFRDILADILCSLYLNYIFHWIDCYLSWGTAHASIHKNAHVSPFHKNPLQLKTKMKSKWIEKENCQFQIYQISVCPSLQCSTSLCYFQINRLKMNFWAQVTRRHAHMILIRT